MGYEVLYLVRDSDSARVDFNGGSAAAKAHRGPSGVGKSSLLNAVARTCNCASRLIAGNGEGAPHHDHRAAIPLTLADKSSTRRESGSTGLGRVARAVAGFFRDLRPYVSRCQSPTARHAREDGRSDAVADGRHVERRYDSSADLAGDWSNGRRDTRGEPTGDPCPPPNALRLARPAPLAGRWDLRKTPTKRW